ncbi:MAG TPA: tRNA 2-selenouridine(34) synthase MnmH [Chitinophagaceae bacterium]|jgi:tRNA 2-selenouridine synthase|nr:tRNA 2-selenouridine(34) synthase MnmH [Chitinophagaceae bacterium]
MATERIQIDDFLELARQHPVIDVRSPGEYNHAHIPGAHSLPLFTDDERKIVGTTYKQQSREQAIKVGLDFFGPKMRKMLEEAERICPHASKSRVLLVYCWRGGMRSAGMSWLMDLYGFRVYTLVGGYKRFRNYVLDTFRFPYSFQLIGGFTGSGKTELLKALGVNGQAVIDLEALACHRGSAFGNIGMPKQPSQEMFENQLALLLRQKSGDGRQTIWLEDESQRIGDLNIPHELWKTMRQSPVQFLEIPFEERLKKIVLDYGPLDRQRLVSAIERITNRLGGLEAKKAIRFLQEDNITESFRILLTYYDKFYLKSLHNRDNLNSLLRKIPCKTVESANAEKLLLQSR